MRCDAENLLPNHFFEPWPINCRQGPLEIKDTDSECIVKTMCSERSDTCLNSTYTVPEVLTLVHLTVRFWNCGELYHQYSTSDMEHRVPELIAFATKIMTMYSGDVISCGTNHEGLGPLQEGDLAEIEIQGIGRMAVKVSDPLKRTWERGVYMGPDSTNPVARRPRKGDG